MDSANSDGTIHHGILEITVAGTDKENTNFVIFPSDGSAVQEFVSGYLQSDNQDEPQLGTHSHLVSSESSCRSDLDLKSIPDQILATEEDLGYNETEMIIVEDPQSKIKEEVYSSYEDSDNPITEANRPTQDDTNTLQGIPDEAMNDDGSETASNSDLLRSKNGILAVETMSSHIQLTDSIDEHKERDVSAGSGLEGVEVVYNNDADFHELEPRIRLPFTFPGQSFNEQAQKLILNVWEFFKRAKKNPYLLENLKGPQDHAAAALNVGTKTIGKIAKRVLRLGKLETPGKKRNRPKTVLDSVGAEGEDTIRSIIRDMYERRVAPTVPLVLAEVKAKINFKGSTTSLRRILKRMGYKYGGIDNSLIQSDKVFVSGWKEKSSKKKFRTHQVKKKVAKNEGKQPVIEVMPSSSLVVPQIVESDGIIASHEITDMMQPREVILHFQKPEDAYATGHNQIITVTTDQTDIIQLQLDTNGDRVNVQEWHWQPCPQDSSSLGLKSL